MASECVYAYVHPHTCLYSLHALRFLFAASIGVISTPMGSVCSGFMMDLIGRKTVIMISTIPYAIGFTLISFSANAITLCVARAIVGFAGGKYRSWSTFISK